MATLGMDHFQQYGSDDELLDGVYAQNDGWTISTANPPRPGYKHLRAVKAGGTGPGFILRRIFGAAKTGPAGVGHRLFVPNLPSAEDINAGIVLLGWLDAANGIQTRIICGTDGALVAYRGGGYSGVVGNTPGFTFLERSAPCITSKAYNQIEGKAIVNASGALEVRVNGVVRLNFSGDTLGTANVEASQFWVQGPNWASGMLYMDIADLHYWDDLAGEGATDFAGNVGVLRRRLKADTAQADMTLSTGGVGYSLLIDDDDTTGIVGNAVDDKSSFEADDLPAGASGIIAQQLSWRGKKTDAGDCDVAPSFVSGSDETDVTGQPQTPAQTWRWGVSGTDPATDAPWTFSGANASLPTVTRTL